MSSDKNELEREFCVLMATLGAADRLLYREMRSEYWRQVAANHQDLDVEALQRWQRGSS